MRKANLALIFVVAALAFGLYWFVRMPEERFVLLDRETQPASATATTRAAGPPEAAAAEIAPQRSAAELLAGSRDKESPAPAPPTKAAPTVTGRVYDLRGNPLSGVRLSVSDRPAEEITSSADGGRFEFPWPKVAIADFDAARWVNIARAQRWTSALRTPFTEEHCTDLVIVAAPSIELAGVVEDETGGSVEGAKITLSVSSKELREFPMPLDRSAPLEFIIVSAAGGLFRIPQAPAVAGCTLRASFKGTMNGALDLPLSTALDLRIVLHAPVQTDKQTLSGVVLSAEGQPVAHALVRFGASTTKTSADGQFELPIPGYVPEGTPLVAVQQGFQAAMVSDIAERIARADFTPLVLRLGPAALAIGGRVLQSDGSAAVGWNVTLADGTEVTRGSVPPVIAENYAGGHSKTTDSKGAFTLGGLSNRNYTVRAWNLKTLISLRAEGVPAGSADLILRVPADATWSEVRGIVVDRRGMPVPMVSVGLNLVTFASRDSQSWESSTPVYTDAAGRFLLKDVPRREVRLSISGDSVIELHVDAAKIHPESELRLVVDLRCHFRLLCERTEDVPSRATVLDESGEELSVYTFESGGWSSSTAIDVNAKGGTHAFAVSERARTLVLFRGDVEVSRIPMNLIAGQVTDLRF